MKNITNVLEAYDLNGKGLRYEKYGSGHIHATYLVNVDGKAFILQCFNNQVFKYPERISNNQRILSQHLGGRTMPFALPIPIRNRESRGPNIPDSLGKRGVGNNRLDYKKTAL